MKFYFFKQIVQMGEEKASWVPGPVGLYAIWIAASKDRGFACQQI